MGLPYSKEIRGALDQVTPLVAAGFEVLQTTKNIAILVTCVQVATVVCLVFILFALIGLLFTMNPDLEQERRELVTPVMRYLGSWLLTYGRLLKYLLNIFIVVSLFYFVRFLWQGYTAGARSPSQEEGKGDEVSAEKPDEKPEAEGKGDEAEGEKPDEEVKGWFG